MNWIKINERLPEINQWCFFWFGGSKPVIGNYKGDGKFLCSEDNDIWSIDKDNITYWMPCPLLPEELKQ